METYFEIVSKYADAGLELPKRGTANSAGYDIAVAEDTILPAYALQEKILKTATYQYDMYHTYTLDEVKKITKNYGVKPTLVPTGVKCHLKPNQYLELSVRSSTPLKYWLIMANGVGIIDADYASPTNENEGHIFFQIINLFPEAIILHKGDIIGQGIIRTYDITDNDNASGDRTGGFGSTT